VDRKGFPEGGKEGGGKEGSLFSSHPKGKGNLRQRKWGEARKKDEESHTLPTKKKGGKSFYAGRVRKGVGEKGDSILKGGKGGGAFPRNRVDRGKGYNHSPCKRRGKFLSTKEGDRLRPGREEGEKPSFSGEGEEKGKGFSFLIPPSRRGGGRGGEKGRHRLARFSVQEKEKKKEREGTSSLSSSGEKEGKEVEA